jgi:hypothetical protein
LTYRFFFYWLCHYWFAAREYVEDQRSKPPTQWGNAHWLFETLSRRDKRRNRWGAHLDIGRFLTDEQRRE